MSRTFAALAVPDYRWYAAGQLLSNTGTWMQRVAQDWLVLEITGGSGLALGITTALQFLPFLVLAPLAGLLADRVERRVLLAVGGLVAAATAAGLGVAVLLGAATPALVYVFALVLGVASAMDSPARQAFVGELVGQQHLVNAVALNSASFNLARVTGPGAGRSHDRVGGHRAGVPGQRRLVRARRGTLAALQPHRFHRDQGRGSGRATLRAGLVHLRGRRDLVFVLVLVGVVATFGLNFQLTTALMARDEFATGAEAYGLMGTVLAMGSLVGSLRAAGRGRPRLRLVVLAAVGFAAVEVVAGLMPTYVTFLAVLPLCGVAALTFITAAQSYLQLGVPPALRGRVMGIYTLVFFGGSPVGAPVLGWVADSFGPRWGLVGGGALAAAGVLAATAVVLRRTHSRVTTHLRPRPHLHLVPSSQPA